MNRITIPAKTAVSIELSRSHRCRVVNTEGGQVVDTWVFNANDVNEYLSMAHSRTAVYRLLFQPGDVLVSNRFRPMIRFTRDTSPGFHDSLHAACSAGSNQFFGLPATHANCQNNLKFCMAEKGHTFTHVPDPWNLFEHAVVGPGLTLADEPSKADAGDYVELEAAMNVILVCSACPSTVGGISGKTPCGAAIELLD